MNVIVFEAAIVTRDDGSVLIALFDGSRERCVALLRCSQEAASALREALGSVDGAGTS